ncbi:hypothetical protein L1987_20122 [Smallanthus sonchifolius]|uniref:Uncharacterized protein n=1 Tax=Smallanthus sonchifolius TaxID=185202 RepID=A0ACB9ISM9_9ASTR|nr:hypothetical protein L1987_20122 [Smallanthus sonchifolius]
MFFFHSYLFNTCGGQVSISFFLYNPVTLLAISLYVSSIASLMLQTIVSWISRVSRKRFKVLQKAMKRPLLPPAPSLFRLLFCRLSRSNDVNGGFPSTSSLISGFPSTRI